MLRSLRSRLIAGSVLWTAGMLALIHVFSLLFLHMFPWIFRLRFTWPVIFGMAMMAAGASVLLNGLKPFRQLRGRLADVRTGRDQRVVGKYPSEVQPLVDDLNALLAEREKAFTRALATAGDLAHGLKTPLAVLAQESERAVALGDAELAESIARQVERMRRQVDYHLARARAASGATADARCPVSDSVEGLVRTLLKLHAGRSVDIQQNALNGVSVRIRREDLDEMLGNLLDNACKWARSQIRLDAVVVGGMVMIAVDDDGPGLPPHLRTLVLERGVRADETAPGSGLGLAIVRDLAGLYGGTIALSESPLGGLRAKLSLPEAFAI